MKELNHLGYPVEDLVLPYLCTSHPSAESMIKALRYLIKKAPVVRAGLDEFTPTDILTLRMAKLFYKDGDISGKAVCPPDDVLELLFPGYVAKRDAYEKEHACT